jgi:hypothetical protein
MAGAATAYRHEGLERSRFSFDYVMAPGSKVHKAVDKKWLYHPGSTTKHTSVSTKPQFEEK